MKVLLFIVSLLTFFGGFFILLNAQSAIHEIESFLLFLIATVFMCTAAILEALHVVRNQLRKGVVALTPPAA